MKPGSRIASTQPVKNGKERRQLKALNRLRCDTWNDTSCLEIQGATQAHFLRCNACCRPTQQPAPRQEPLPRSIATVTMNCHTVRQTYRHLVLSVVALVAIGVALPAHAGGCFKDSTGRTVCCDDNGYCTTRPQ